MGEPHVEVAGVAVFRRDRGGELVLLVLQHERKPEFVPQPIEIEFGHHLAGDAIMEPIRGRHEPERKYFSGHAEVVEHVQSRGMQRRGALVLDRGGFLFQHGDGDAAPVERERADHPDGTGPDDDHSVVRALGRHELGRHAGLAGRSRLVRPPMTSPSAPAPRP